MSNVIELSAFKAAGARALPSLQRTWHRWTSFLRQGSGCAQESRSFRRQRPKLPKTPEFGPRVATHGGVPTE